MTTNDNSILEDIFATKAEGDVGRLFEHEVLVSKRHLVELIRETAYMGSSVPAIALFRGLIINAPDAAIVILDQLVERNLHWAALNLLDDVWGNTSDACEALDARTFFEFVNIRADLMRHVADQVNAASEPCPF